MECNERSGKSLSAESRAGGWCQVKSVRSDETDRRVVEDWVLAVTEEVLEKYDQQAGGDQGSAAEEGDG